MYQRSYKVPVRSEWSEFSLRSRPRTVKRFQAGISNADQEDGDRLYKTERELRKESRNTQPQSDMQDSIEFDVFTISMSYPEGRLRMLEQIDRQFKNKVASTSRETNEKKQKVTSVPLNRSLKTDETCRKRREEETNWVSNKNIGTSRHISRSLFTKDTSDKDHKFQSDDHIDKSDRSRSRKHNKSSSKSSQPEPTRNQKLRTLQEYECKGRSSSSGHTESRESSRSPSRSKARGRESSRSPSHSKVRGRISSKSPSHSKARGRGKSRSSSHSESSKRSSSSNHIESRSSSQLLGLSKSRSSSRSSGQQETSERSWSSGNRGSREGSWSVYYSEFGERLRSHDKETRSKKKLHETEERSSSSIYRSRSRSPESRYKPMKGRTIFTAKKFVERRPPKFSLKDILGNNSEERTTADDQMPESISRSDVSAMVSPEHQACKSSVFDFQFPRHIDAWIDEFNAQDDGSLLALLNCEGEGNSSKTGYHSNNSVNSNSDDSYAGDHEHGHNRKVKMTKIKCNNSNHSNNSLESESHYKNHEGDNESNCSHGNNNNDSDTEDEDAQFYYENMLNHRTDNKKDSQTVWPDGSLVWARLSKTRWWPAILITGSLAGQKPARGGWTWLMWFGDHKISKIRLSQIVSFASHFRQHCRGKLTAALESAIVECLKVCADRAGVPLGGYNDIKRWGLLEMGFLDLINSYEESKDPFEPQINSEFPACIQKELRKLRDQAEDSDFSSYSEEFPPLHNAENVGDNNNGVDFCLSCAKHNKTLACHHPLFEGYVCSQCKDALLEGLLAYDNDGCNLFCVVCGEGGELYVCESNNCGRSFCVRCMKHYLSSDSLKQVRSRSPWLCFLCTKYSQDTHGILLPREDHQDEIVKFFNPISVQRTRCDPAYFTGRKLRVLSLFDGIGCARLALEQLGLDVEVYYASENDANAQHVCMFNQGFSIVHVGDLDNINSNKLQEMCPIDLVLASPPSEDLDVTNREYEGFNGTGMYILKVMKILKNLEIISQGHYTVHWLLQCTAAIKSEYKHVVSNLFEMEPCMWDAQYFSPYVLPRLYWGNIPGLYSALEYYREHKGDNNSLDLCLTQNVHRTARVPKLRNCAIDTNITSPLVTGEPAVVTGEPDESDRLDKDIGNWEPRIVEPKMNANSTIFTLPVLMDDKETNIWVGEVERVLGVPAHYTDVSRLNIQQRQKLLKTAPSVHVLKHLLSPLTELFLTKS